MTEREEFEALRLAACYLIAAMDDMHSRGETFTARVSVCVYEVRKLLESQQPREKEIGYI